MSNIRIPGVFWVVALILIVGVVHSYEGWIIANTPFNAIILDAILGSLLAVAKGIDVQDLALDRAIDLIEKLLNQQTTLIEDVTPKVGMRGVEAEPVRELLLIDPDEVPARPSKTARWLMG